MGKAYKVKKELIGAIDLVGLIQTLKDVADNKYYTLTGQKDTFRRFGETFLEYFHMISLSDVDHPLIKNNNKTVGVLAVTIEGGFLGEFNNKIVRSCLNQKTKYEDRDIRFIAVGDRKVDELKAHTPDIQVFSGMEEKGLYETAIEVKDYLIDEIMNERLGSVVVCYSWAKDFENQRQRVTRLFPCDDLLQKQTEFKSEFEKVIEESDPKETVGMLCDLWATTRLYEIFVETLISSAAAQAKFLEDRVESMEKEKKKTFIKYRKARKTDIDTSLRETCSARMVSG